MKITDIELEELEGLLQRNEIILMFEGRFGAEQCSVDWSLQPALQWIERLLSKLSVKRA